MSISMLIRSMAAAGASSEAIAIAVEAIEAAEAKVEQSRAAARERKRRQRDKAGTVTGQSRDTDGTVTPETPSLSPSPQTPQPHTHPRDEETTRAREGQSSAVVIDLPVAATDWPDGDCRRWADLLASEVNHHRLDPSKAEGLLLTSARLAAWRSAGASWQFDVVPTVTALASRSGRRITSWKFFDDAIAQSIADNRAALSIPEAQSHASQTDERLPSLQAARRENRDRASTGADWAAEVVAARRAM